MTKRVLASFGVAVVALVAVIACGGQPDPTALEREPAPFLDVIVPPCIPYPGSDVDPCERRSYWRHFDPFVEASVEFPVIVKTLEEHILGLNDHPRFAPQIIVRAIAIPGSYRCKTASYSFYHSTWLSSEDYRILDGQNHCHVDLAVNEYIYGTGPDRLTINTGVVLGEEKEDDPVEVAYWERVSGDLIEGTEWIMFLIAPWDYGVAAWQQYWTLDVQMTKAGDVVVVRRSKYLYENDPTVNRATNLSRIEVSLDDFRARARASMEKYVSLTGGRWGTGTNEFGGPFPLLASDASTETLITLMLEDRALQVLEVTPVGPPPVPGENDPNPDGLVINDIIATRVAGGEPAPGG